MNRDPRMCLLRALDKDKTDHGLVRARSGRRRWYLSPKDADSYDRGVSEFDPGAVCLGFGPYADGWWDAFSEHEERSMSDLDVTEEE